MRVSCRLSVERLLSTTTMGMSWSVSGLYMSVYMTGYMMVRKKKNSMTPMSENTMRNSLRHTLNRVVNQDDM